MHALCTVRWNVRRLTIATRAMAATTTTPWPADIDPSTWSSAPAVSGADTEAIKATTEFVKKAMADNDASHDWAHISRVKNTALTLAVEEGKGEDMQFMEMVELAALLHDVADWKYAKEGKCFIFRTCHELQTQPNMHHRCGASNT